jgi:multiple sugar transport system ATP-binding protein
VAGFIGSPAMNILPTRLDGSAVVLGSEKVDLEPAVARAAQAGDGRELKLGVRPQGLSLGATGAPATVKVVEELGSETFVFAELEHLGETTRVRVRVDADVRVARGDDTHIEVVGPVHLFGADGLRLKTSSELDA